MNEIHANWEKKENYMKKRLMRVASIENKNRKGLKNEDLQKVKSEFTYALKQVYKVAAKSCNIEKMQYKTKQANLDTQIKNLEKILNSDSTSTI
ncbi:40948_t:CDS:2 [Gigaspora margarita]|uniref:40948_t:CDS:1 n=1 Tax=Gigaspora margarita TaxID=4874 RepID=A0ABN7VB09_GIGMA|nr:40948_t:CDS:2 [Gigaspora margarita]